MKDSFNKVYQTAEKYKVPLRIAAYIVAIDKVSQTYRYRGVY
jgi:glutamate dehydrogenase (NAD(P)+)